MMKFSRALIHTDKHKKIEYSFDWVTKAGLVHKYNSGSFGYTPLGQRVLDRITDICDEEMVRAGVLKVSAPVIQPAELWIKTGRWEIYGDEMLKMKNRDGQQLCAAPTHEEALTDLVSSVVRSYKQLPITIYQIGIKYRDELRPRHLLLRTREFLMLDGYGFYLDNNSLIENYAIMKRSFERIFSRMGLNVVISNADSGEVGGNFSEEFLAPASYGEDIITVDEDEIKGIEVGHIFQLGTRYSESMNFILDGSDGTGIHVVMGCYGIGVSRLIPTIIDQNHDERGIIWPASVAPYDVEIIALGNNSSIRQAAGALDEQLESYGIRSLFDDREVNAGMKFGDADVIGIPRRLIMGKTYLKDGRVEIEDRKTKSKNILSLEEAVSMLEGGS